MRLKSRNAAIFLSLIAIPAGACPDDQYDSCAFGICVCLIKGPAIPKDIDPIKIIVNPTSYINSAGIPTQGDFVEEVIKHPDTAIEMLQNPGQFPYLPVANGMISSRNAIVARGQRMPEDMVVSHGVV